MSIPYIKVGELADQIRGVTYAKEDAEKLPIPGYLPVLRAGNITEEGLVFEDLVYVPAHRISSSQMVRQHDVIIAASSGSLDVVGKAAPALADFDGGFGAFCKVLRPNQKVHPGYFAHYFKTKDYRRLISSLAAGANINNLKNEHLDDLLVPLPPLPEQRRIAAILDQAEAMRTKRRAALAKLDRLAQSIFIEMFGDPLSNPKGFPQMKLAQVSQFENGDRSSNYPSGDEVISEGVLFLSTKNLVEKKLDLAKANYISENKFQSLTRGKARNGDLLITLRGTLGSCCIFNAPDGRAFINAQMMIIRPTTKVTSSFLHALLTGSTFKRHLVSIGNGAAVQQLTATQLAELMIMVPPPDLQNEFTQKIGSVERYRGFFEESLVGTEALLTSLQHRAFRGEL